MRKLLLVIAVGLLGACAPSINPQMKSATDELMANVKGGHTEGAPANYQPMPWAEGQWVLLKITDSKGQPSLVRISVVGRENGGFWVEQETQDYFRHNINKTLYAHMPKDKDDAVDAMLKMVSKDDDKPVQVFDFGPTNPAASFTKAMMKYVAASVVVPSDVSGMAKEDATVAAGTFQACAKYNGTFAVGPISKDVASWFHPAVPINGAVKGKSTDGEWTTELLDYGVSGAVSKLP